MALAFQEKSGDGDDDEGHGGAYLLRVIQRTSWFTYTLLKAFVCHSLQHKYNGHLLKTEQRRQQLGWRFTWLKE